MIKSDNWILEHKEIITPFNPEKTRNINGLNTISFGLSQSGYDLTLSSEALYFFHNERNATVDPKRFDDKFHTSKLYTIQNQTGEFFRLPPNSSALGSVNEILSMPNNIAGLVWGKSTYSRCNVNVYCQPVEPGWKGQLSILIVNYNDNTVKIYANEGICQIVFFELDAQSKNPYTGKYQNQSGVTFAKVE